MGTPGAGRKRTPIKDRFSAEDEALSHIAREAEARLAAKRAARAEARDIRMKELERQQKELYRSSNRKWGEIHQWMENTERAKHSFRPHQHYLTADDAFSVRSASSQRHPSLDVGVSYRSSSRQKDLGSLSRDKDKSAQLKKTSRSSSVYSNAQAARKKLSTSSNDILSGIYHDKRKYSTLSSSKSFSSSYTRPSSLYSAPIITTKSYRASYDTGLTRSQSLASLNDEGLHSRDWRYNSRTPTGSSFASQASSMHNSPWNSDDETLSTMSQDSQEHCDNMSPDFSDQSGSTAAYFSRSSRRGSVISDFDDLTVPDLSSLDEKTESFSRPASRNAVSGLSAATLASLGGPSSRRGSGDMSSILDPDVSLSEMRDSLSEVEEKYKKAMVSNAQLDNDKSNLIYQVDTLKDVIEEMEEQMAELYRENEDKSKELERQKHMYHVSQHKVEELKEGIRQRDELIENHGLVIIPESTPNGDLNHDPVVGAITVVSQEAAHVLEGAGDGPLDVRLKKLADEKEELLTQIRKLKLQLEEERQKSSKVENVLTDSDRLENGTDLQILEMQRDANRQLSEYKFKLSKAEQDFATVEQNVARLEGQLHRYKSATENSEKVEDELKAEKRRLQRELRLALDKNEEMEMTNSHLVKRLEKMKANRNALLSQQ
ncbi:leucine-rich repeat flightless-interacting protein 2 isoform X14 [Amblyraja radiata]|uniref:leucine-rich repeat flightless-interacting protein 2 isoform X14 n=1 Tax=Amblyraja radiata TaxID=386614 RepID=UPI001402AA99|nr:leucine-rich repeat flightless-interacting protein 2 isoform X14 [Amblyraja radiata]